MEVLEDKVFWLAVEAFKRRKLVSKEVLKKIAYQKQSLIKKLNSSYEAIKRQAIEKGL